MNMLFLRHLIQSILDFLFPKSELVLKLEAMDASEVIALLQNSPEKMETPTGGIVSIFPYRNKNVHDLIHEIKYAANQILADKIAPILYETCVALNSKNVHKAVLTFVPTTKSRKEKRGFDQGSIILEAIRKHDASVNSQNHQLAFDYDRDALGWTRNVAQQSLTENKEERVLNMRHAIACTHPIPNKSIIVLDDVCTTGATLTDAKRALEEAGILNIYLLTIAH